VSTAKERPLRTCLGCRLSLDQGRLIRYVLDPEKRIVVDYRKKLPGRGAYTCAAKSCIMAAAGKGRFERAFRESHQPVSGEELAENVAQKLRERLLNLVGIARKSGCTISGSNLVMETLRGRGGLGIIILGEDIAPSIGEKVTSRAAGAGVPCVYLFDKRTLGQVVGKGDRSVVGIKTGSQSKVIRDELSVYKEIVGEIEWQKHGYTN